MITRESLVGVVSSWATLVASFVLSFTTWIALGQLAGFDYVWLALPVCVDGYIVCALVTWMNPVSDRVASFARWNMYCAAAIGVITQSAYHGASIYAKTSSGWQSALATVVGALPPLFSALSVHMRGLVQHAIKESQLNEATKTTKVEAERIQTPVTTPELPDPHYPTLPPTLPKVNAPLASTVQVPSTNLDNNSKPKTQPKTKPTSRSQDDIDLEKLAAQTRKLFADTGQTLGRGPLAKELGITEHQARRVLTSLNGHGGK